MQEAIAMTKFNREADSIFGKRIDHLIEGIRLSFPPARLTFPWEIVKDYGAIDAHRDGGLLAGKLWNDVTIADFDNLDASGVRVGLSAQGMVCYLPMFMTKILKTRAFGWFEELLLPIDLGLEDVVAQFSGFSLEDPENSFRELYRERVVYAKQNLLPGQLECVGRYIEIAESYGKKNPTLKFQTLLKKYTDFWRHDSVSTT